MFGVSVYGLADAPLQKRKYRCLSGFADLYFSSDELRTLEAVFEPDSSLRLAQTGTHAAFAPINTDHCAHVSLDPMEDPKGLIKCQETNFVSAREHISDEDWLFYVEEMERNGIDPVIGFK